MRLAPRASSIDAGDLVLEATAPPPQDVLDLLRRHKTSIVTLLGVGHDGWTAEDWQMLQAERAAHIEFDCGLPRASAEARAFEGCLIEWLNRHPAPSREGRCAWCGRSETQQAVVLPYGTEPGTHTWLSTANVGAPGMRRDGFRRGGTKSIRGRSA
jgi:hypothetical protein